MWLQHFLAFAFVAIPIYALANEIDLLEEYPTDVDESDCQPNDGIHPFEVAVGDNVEISCSVKNSMKCTTWQREDGKQLPEGSVLSGSNLIIHGTQEDAAGIYKCVPCNSTPEKCTIVAAHLIVYPSQIPITSHVNVYVDPAKSYLGLGESTTIYCTSTSTNCTISWIRMDRELPANFHPQGNRLIIANFRKSDAGQYACMCNTRDGHGFGANFDLSVETPPAHIEVAPKRILRAQVGSDVDLICDKPHSAVAYRWKRVRGFFKIGTSVTRRVLQLKNVQMSDADTYICEQFHGSSSVPIPFELKIIDSK